MKSKLPNRNTLWPGVKDALKRLPLAEGEVWQADIKRFPGWVGEGPRPRRPWMMLVASRSRGLVLAHDLSMKAPTMDWIWGVLAKGMLSPAAGEAHRPAEIQVRAGEHRDILTLRLASIGSSYVVQGRLDEWDDMYEMMTRGMGSDLDSQALVKIPGVGLEGAEALFTAAASFFQRAPWEYVESDTMIRVDSSIFERTPWYAVVIGQSGMVSGLALYDDLEALRTLVKGGRSDEEGARMTSAVSLTYGSDHETPIPDLDAAEEHRWPVAGPKAYPTVIRVFPGGTVRTPTPGEIYVMIHCLRHLPDFLEHPDAVEARVTLKMPEGEFLVNLSLVES